MSFAGTTLLSALLCQGVHHVSCYGSSAFLCVPLLAGLYVIWRLWRFTIIPSLHPLEPKEIRYWIPILGHTISFFRDYNGTLAHGRYLTIRSVSEDTLFSSPSSNLNANVSRQHLGYSDEVYKLSFVDQEVYLMTSPEDISIIYKNTVDLTYDTFIRDTLLSLGVSTSAVDKWIPPRLSNSDKEPVSNKPVSFPGDFTHLGEKLCQRQLLPGKELDILQSAFMGSIHRSLHWENFSGKETLQSLSETKTVSLLGWCREILLKASTVSFFGDRLLQINPDLFQSFLVFDASSWKLNYGYPSCLSKDMASARDSVIKALTTYFQLPKAERPGAAFLIQNFETELRLLDIQDKDIAALIMTVYWVINANAYKACFWMMSHILFDPKLLASLRQEISPAIADESPGLEYRLEQQCPRLKAAYHEVLRLAVSSATVRGIQSPTKVGDKILKSGANILIPYRQLHHNPEVFGIDPQQFDPDRFLRNLNLAKSPSFRPFGGGKTYCPGRYLAEREILTFVALAIHRFDIVFANGWGDRKGSGDGLSLPDFPRLDTKKFCLGLMEPVKGDDLILDIRVRSL